MRWYYKLTRTNQCTTYWFKLFLLLNCLLFKLLAQKVTYQTNVCLTALCSLPEREQNGEEVRRQFEAKKSAKKSPCPRIALFWMGIVKSNHTADWWVGWKKCVSVSPSQMQFSMLLGIHNTQICFHMHIAPSSIKVRMGIYVSISFLLQNVSVLENHHWRSTIGMLRESRLLAHLPKEDR